jgi:hypothetical protein
MQLVFESGTVPFSIRYAGVPMSRSGVLPDGFQAWKSGNFSSESMDLVGNSHKYAS